MADYTPPALAGHATEATLDQANIAMRAMPWYQNLIKSFGQDPNNVKLTKNQSQQVVKQAQANGFVIDEGSMHVDESGNIDKKGHAVRNTLIVAGIAGATIATMGAAGAFSGAALAGSGAAASGGGAAAAGGATAAGIAGGAAIPAALGGTLVPTTTAGLAALSAGSTIGGGAALAGGGGAALGGAGTLGTAAKIGGMLSQGKGASGYLNTAGQVANVLGDYSAGRAAGRVDEANMGMAQDRAAMDRSRADLDAKKFALTAPGQRASNSVRGDMLANAKPFSWTGGSDMVGQIPVPRYEGGMSPTMFSDNTRALGRGMSADALAGQQSGADTLALPTATPLPQAGKLDSILNTAATVGSLASAIPYKRQGRIPVPGDPDYVPPTPQRR